MNCLQSSQPARLPLQPELSAGSNKTARRMINTAHVAELRGGFYRGGEALVFFRGPEPECLTLEDYVYVARNSVASALLCPRSPNTRFPL